ATVRIDRSTGRVEVGNTTTPRAALAAAIAEEGYTVAP
ncbi:MAG: heavy metal transport/detoxification protein, partial [Acidovorax sp.]